MKIIKMILSPLSLGLMTLSLAGCNGSNSDSKSGAVSLLINGTKKGSFTSSKLAFQKVGSLATSSVDLVDSNGTIVGSISLTDARVSLKEIEFEMDNLVDDAESSNDFEFQGPYVVDLITDTVTPSLDTVSLPLGVYREIELKLDKIEGDEDDDLGNQLVDPMDPLFGKSIYLEGTYTGPSASGAQTAIPFKMSFELDEEFELTGANDTSEGLAIDANGLNLAIISFRMQKWFQFDDPETNGSNLSLSLLELTGGEIVLDKDSAGINKSLRDVIKENIKQSADYGEDANGDGILGPDEDDDPDTDDGNDD